MHARALFLPTFASLATAQLLWDGRFLDIETAADLKKWSWSDQVGPYQAYIKGNKEIDSYVELSPAYKNPADLVSRQGAKITLDETSYWKEQEFRRTELIPLTTAPINESKVYYHFSILRKAENPPDDARLHKIAFFEGGFSELWSGWAEGDAGTTNTKLRWIKDQEQYWDAEWTVEVWQNFAYEVNFEAGEVGLWYSTGSDNLKEVVAPVPSNNTISNAADFHVGWLELAREGYPDKVEDIYFSSVYIEGGDLATKELTTSLIGPCSDLAPCP